MDTTPTPNPETGSEQPKKYIRTFAGDMEILSKGGSPDLTPLESGGADTLQEATLPEQAPLMESATAPISAAVSQAAPTPVLESELGVPVLTPLKTYSGDFAERMKETEATTATVLAAEQDATPPETPEIPTAPENRNGWYIAVGILLLLAGAVGIYFAYSRFIASVAPVVVETTIPAPIFVDETEQISGSSADMMKMLKQSVSKPLPPNGVRLITLGAGTATNTTVFSALAVRAPSGLVRNIDASGSMAGVVKVGGEQSPFFILSVVAYGPTFSGMLSWEPHLQDDLSTIYPLYPAVETLVGTTTSPTTPTFVATKAVFTDEVVSNHDVRIYRDAAARSVLLYGYWNQETLIIARDPSAFTEIVTRLANSRTR